MRFWLMRFALLSVFLSALCPAHGADVTGRPPLLHDGTVYARRYGNGKRALILVPGLACGAWVWNRTIKDFQNEYTIYAVTLAGCYGTPPPIDQNDLLKGYVTSLAPLIATEHLVKPIIIGHSLGGHLAVRLAEQEPDALGGIVIADSLPLFPPLQPGETMEARKKNAPTIALQLLQQPADRYAAYERQSCRFLVTDEKTADAVANKCLRSDRATVAHSAAKMMSYDFGPALASAKVPMLLLVPAPGTDAADQIKNIYTTAYQGVPSLDVQAIVPSRHFVMFDQPELFESALRGFLTKNTVTTP